MQSEEAWLMIDEFEVRYPRDIFPEEYLVVFNHRNDLVLVRGSDGILRVLR